MTGAAILGLKLPFSFDAHLLHRDLALVQPAEWSPHYNERDFGGEWRGVALRSPSGLAGDLIATPPVAVPVFHDTPLLARCAYFQEILARFDCPLKSARLLSLEPGSFIREHSDHALGFEDGEVRIHIPIQTNPSVEFYVCGERLLLTEGGCYYVNVNLPHRVNNRGSAARVHLVIDAEVNHWVRRLFLEQCGSIERSALPPGSLEDFRKAVLHDATWQRTLQDIPDRRDFIKQTIALGREHGFDFHEADVDAGFRSRATVVSQAPAGWTPVKARFPEADWIFTGGRRFTEPFFEDTVRACLRNPFTALFRVTAPLPTNGAADPAGFIFHMSRCGSTLVSQMLAALPGIALISEAPPVDDALQTSLPEALRSVIGALGNPKFVKFDAWHIHSLASIRAAFPQTPWIFVYRDPVEVLVSHLRMPGNHTIPGAIDPARLGLAASDIEQLNRTQWSARVLANFLRRALQFRDDPAGLFINYSNLPEAVTGPIARHFGLSLAPVEENTMRQAGRLDAKNPSVRFEPDTQAKQHAGAALRSDPEVAALSALYEELETFASAPATKANCSAQVENPASA